MQFNTSKIEWQWIVQNEQIEAQIRHSHPYDSTRVCPDLCIPRQHVSILSLALHDVNLPADFFVLWKPPENDEVLDVLSTFLYAESPGAHLIAVPEDASAKHKRKSMPAPDQVKCELILGNDAQAAAAAVSIAYWNGTDTESSRHAVFIDNALYRYEVRFDNGSWAARIADSAWRS